LLAKSASGKPKEIRLAAIASLGTLGVPETLPMLVELMSDGDRDIAAAAKSAVDRMNAAGKKAE
jgi:HEAT repeat protein